MRRLWITLGLVVVGFLIGAMPVLAQRSVTVTLVEQSGSGQTGTAVLTEEGNQTGVVIQLSNAPANVP